MIWPEPTSRVKIPEGHYSFRLNREPEIKHYPYTDKNGNQQEGTKVVIYAIGLAEDGGSFSIADAFLPFEQRYRDLCASLGVEHGRDIQAEGSVFEADIVHEPDKKDPTKSWPRIVNIAVQEDVPPTPNGEGEDIPF